MTVRQGGGVVLMDGRVVLRRNARGEYLFPKGHLEEGETPEQAALREVAEEVGVEAEILGDLGEVSFALGEERVVVSFFLMRAVRTLPGWDQHLRTDTIVVSADEASRIVSFENYRELWRRAQEFLRASA